MGFAGLTYWHFSRDLPDYQQLADYQPPIVTRVHAGDGRLLAEYATERRIFVPVSAIPPRVIHAFLAAEDKNFYSHPGIDICSMARAALTNVAHFGSNRRPIGASTITQQVAKNFLLTNEVSLERKVKEALLALRIEQVLSKDRILELYLNEIYLGGGAYGVAAASLNYFDKSLDELTIAEAAFLGSLPKAPNNYNPQRFPEAAKARRDWVVSRMLRGRLHHRRPRRPLRRRDRWRRTAMRMPQPLSAPYFAEEVRRELLATLRREGALRGRPLGPHQPRSGAAGDCRQGVARRARQLRPAAWLARAGRAPRCHGCGPAGQARRAAAAGRRRRLAPRGRPGRRGRRGGDRPWRTVSAAASPSRSCAGHGPSCRTSMSDPRRNRPPTS